MGLIGKTIQKIRGAFVKKTIGFLLPSLLDDALIFGDAYRQFATHGYGKNVYVYAAIKEIVTALSGIPWILFDKRSGKEIEQHPLLDLLHHPNPMMGGAFFTQTFMSYFLIDGNAYIHAIGPDGGENAGVPQQLWPLRPDLIEVKKGGKGQDPVLGFAFRRNGFVDVPLAFEDVLHLRTFNPLDKFKGLSPISVAALSVTQGNESKRWNVMLLQNQARPPGMFSAQGELTESQRIRFKDEILKKYSSPDNAGRPFLAEGGVKYETFGLSPTDMDWLEGQKLTAREIAIIFGVPPELLGDATNKTYSNFKEARRSFYEETILPTMVWLREEYNRWLAPKFGDELRLEFDTDQVSALQEDRAMLFERVNAATFLTINEKRDATGFEPTEGGDIILVPLNLIPLTGGSAHLDDEDDKRKNKQATSTQSLILSKDVFPTLAKARKWVEDHDFKTTKHDETDDTWRFRQFPPSKCQEGSFRTITLRKGVSAVLCREKEGRCALPDEGKAFNLRDSDQKTLYWKTFDRRRVQFFDRVTLMVSRRLNADFTAAARIAGKAATRELMMAMASEAVKQGETKWFKLFEAIYTTVGEEFAQDVFAQIKSDALPPEIKVSAFVEDDFRDLWQEEIRVWLRANSTTRILGIIDTSIRRVQKEITLGIDAGEGIPQIAKRLLGLKKINTPARAKLIARTETISASNLGSHAAAKAVQIPLKKEWVATPDERVRDAHADADGQIVDGMDSAFQVDGEELLFPGDTSLGATGMNIFNCRCTVVYQTADVAAEKIPG